MSQETKRLMAVSSIVGLTFFVTCNFMGIRGAVVVGIAQIAINIFVHRSWWQGYREARGLTQLAAGIGAIVPVIMASITLYRVIFPALARTL